MAVKKLMSKILKHRRKFVKELSSNYNNFNGIENICKGVLVSLRNEKKAIFKLPTLARDNVPTENLKELELKSIMELDNILGIKLKYKQFDD